MTLRKCNFELEQYSERDHSKSVTTEIINKPFCYNRRVFYISTRMKHGLLCTTYEIGLAESRKQGTRFSLAIEINLGFSVMWGTGLYMVCCVFKHLI